eukprot:5451635-Pyramimonas_sp.AAC.1
MSDDFSAAGSEAEAPVVDLDLPQYAYTLTNESLSNENIPINLPQVDVAAMFNSGDKVAQAKALKEYYEAFGVNNAIQAAGRNQVR